MGLFPALTANMLQMVGVGPFLTIPLILSTMHGPQALAGWILGAILAMCDGLVWAELGAAMPDSGGSYEYLQQAFGPESLGRLMGFLFLWQVMLAAPLTAASGAVGFAEYAKYLVPWLTPVEMKGLAILVCLLSTVLLYRDIRSIGKISIVMWVGLMAAMGFIIWGGITHFSAARAFDFPPGAFRISSTFFLGLGAATLISMYDYSGYFTVCLIGGEVKNPSVTIPRCVILSIAILAVLYLAMSFSIIGVVPWREAMGSQAIVSDYMQRLYGWKAAAWMTGLILWVAFASVFCVLLGFTRVPYAAASEGHFFSAFARLHPTERFPSFSVVFMGWLSAVACFLTLEALIKALIVIQIVTQFAAQCIAVILLRKLRQNIPRPFSMPLYPVPVFIALVGWIFVLVSSGAVYVMSGFALLAFGIGVYLWRARRKMQWPWNLRLEPGDVEF
ncbi:MAG: amino acid permease [Acidobacteriaceae bacterium]|nr:amino acid permease [Acidobacteriaceae bacterium]MBV9781474.1 amino acid permease [Acidobacteriaceae bacterium]